LQILGVRRWRKQCEERAEWKKINEKWVVTPVKQEEEGLYLLLPFWAFVACSSVNFTFTFTFGYICASLSYNNVQ
jgi:hypothetical protein